MNDTNQTLHQMLQELHEASASEIKVLKLEIEALRDNKTVKDEQLNMLYTVMEHHLGINVQSVYNSLEIQRVEERRAQREKELAEEATKRKKELIVETQEAGGSSSHPDVEMVDAKVDQAQGFVLEKEEEVDDELEDVLDAVDNYDPSWDDLIDKDDDDEDQGSTGLIEDHHQESSCSGKQHVDQVFLSQPTIIYLNAPFKGGMEVPRSRAEMLEELGLDNGKFKFDVEDKIPSSPEKEYVFKYAHEADNFHLVEVDDCSDSSEEDTVFHYYGVDEAFPTLAEMFKEQNEDEIRRKVVERIITEGIPRPIPRETLAEERKKWFKVMPKERKFIRPHQYFTHTADISWGDILSWGYLEDLQVYAIRREQGVQYFEFLSDIKTLPWWDVEELVQTKNIKQFYYGLDVKQHDQHLWN
ncbi:hypothetical protein Hanom_Chr15g01405441 [Helianthus anomalus]